MTADRTQRHAGRRRTAATIDHAAPDDADRSSPSARRLMRTVSGRARTDAELRPYAPPHGRVPWITADGIRDPDGSRQGGGRLSYRAYSSRPTTGAGCLPGVETAVADSRTRPTADTTRDPTGRAPSSPEGVACRLSSVRRGRFRGSLHHCLPRSTGRRDPPDARIPAAPQRLRSYRRAPAGSGPAHRPHAAGSGPRAHRSGRARQPAPRPVHPPAPSTRSAATSRPSAGRAPTARSRPGPRASACWESPASCGPCRPPGRPPRRMRRTHGPRRPSRRKTARGRWSAARRPAT